MSEFKFACPVCSQHITADSSASGTQLECPTCFQRIVVPQAPASEDTKFILSAAQAAKPRPQRLGAELDSGTTRRPVGRSAVPFISLVLVLLCAGVATFLLWRGQFLRADRKHATNQTNPASALPTVSLPKSPYSIPTNILWTTELGSVVIPETVVAGKIHESGFQCERATLNGGTLSLRQGKTSPPDLGITIALFARRSEELSGVTVVIAPNRPPPVPRVTLRWKEERQQAVQEVINNNYAMKLSFGRVTNGHLSGRIYIALPDGPKSFAAGTFEAEIRQGRSPGR
jgi:hypothetical protein